MLRNLLGIRKIDRVPNARIRELRGVTNNVVLKPNEMVGVKEDNIESVWVEIICKNKKIKIKLGNFTYPQEWKLNMG